jgi:hypothetical protein
MECVYHQKRDFRGTRLLPLHALAEEYPDLYRAARAKYAGRERLMDYVVPVLGVRWNDVIHCAPIHPRLVYLALRKAGASPEPREWFQIPVQRLPVERTVWFGYRTTFSPFEGDFPPDDEFEPFDPARYRELDRLPAKTLAYYREEVRQGRQPLLRFQHVPHVLVAAPIEVSDVGVIEWSRRPTCGPGRGSQGVS